MDDDYDGRSDAFALDGVLQSRPGTTTTLGDGDKKLLADTQSQVSSLQERAEELEELLKLKDREVSRLREEQEKAQVCSFFFIFIPMLSLSLPPILFTSAMNMDSY
jgi:hypothetical protein